MDSTDQRAISRRTLARGAAWAAPTVALAVAAPAVAASPPANCPEMPTGDAGWTMTQQNDLDDEFAGWIGDTVQVERNNELTTQGASRTIDFDTQIPVEAGIRYTIGFVVQVRKGYQDSGSCETTPSQFNVFINDGSAGGNGFTKQLGTTTGGGTDVILTPPEDCTTNGSRNAEWGADGTVGASRTVSFSYLATQNEDITLRMRFFRQFLQGEGQKNDDFRVTPYFVACEETA